MSVALEYAPMVVVPPRGRTQECERPLASVTVLHRPSDAAAPAPLRLTRRGVLVLGAVVAALAAAVVALAALSAPASSAVPAHSRPATVTVGSGDTLWSIAARVAPGTDPRAEVDTLQRINHLAGVALVAGEVLRTR